MKLSDNHKRIIRDSGTLFLKEFVRSSNIKILRYIWEEEKKVNRITEITKRDILDLFKNGLEIDDFFATSTTFF